MADADRMREAAKVLTDMAKLAAGSPWVVVEDDSDLDRGLRIEGVFTNWRGETSASEVAVLGDSDDAAFMTKMSPPLAILFAEWLVATAHDVEHIHHPVYNLTSTVVSRARKVTDEILGER